MKYVNKQTNNMYINKQTIPKVGFNLNTVRYFNNIKTTFKTSSSILYILTLKFLSLDEQTNNNYSWI